MHHKVNIFEGRVSASGEISTQNNITASGNISADNLNLWPHSGMGGRVNFGPSIAYHSIWVDEPSPKGLHI